MISSDSKTLRLIHGAFDGDGPRRSPQRLGQLRRLLLAGAELVIVVVMCYVLEGVTFSLVLSGLLVTPVSFPPAGVPGHECRAGQGQACQELAAV